MTEAARFDDALARLAFDLSPSGMLAVDAGGLILAANREVVSGRAGGIAPPPGAGRLNPEETGWTSPLLVGEGAVIEAVVRLGPGVVVGPEVHIGRGATVENAVLLEGTDIPAGGRVENEIRSPDSVLSAL